MKCRRSNWQVGFTLVELMVAVTIGLIILVAVSTLFVSSRATYKTQDQLSRLQENARFAMQFMMSDLRLAGYYGCLDNVSSTNVFSVVNSTSLAYSVNQVALEGLENAGTTWFPSGSTDSPAGILSGTDAIVVRFADPSTSAALTARMPNKAAPLTVDSVANFQQNEIVMVANCARADLMQITSITGNTLAHATGGAAPGNLSPADLSTEYDAPARVMKFATRRYYIRNNTATPPVPSLYRDTNGGAAEEMVEGIEVLKVLYGVDTDDPLDGVPNRYVPASAVAGANAKYGWNAVVTVRIGIIARTIDNKNQDPDTGRYDADGDGTFERDNPGDKFRRRVFQSTVQLRNLL